MCYHLFTRAKHAELDEYQQPEMLRVPLQQLCLQVKILNLAPVGSVKHFLDKVRHRTMSSRAHPFTLPPPSLQAIDPPSSEALANAMSVLTRIGALALLPAGSGADGVATSELETLTPLGRHLAFLPMDPQLGKALLCACLFQCLDPILTITAALRYLSVWRLWAWLSPHIALASFRNPFVMPINKQQEVDACRRRLACHSQSDHYALLRAIRGYQHAKRKGHREANRYCWDNYLSESVCGAALC